MQTPDILLQKIEQAKLIGRGGSGYSTATKWREMYEKHHEEIYIAVNGSEGEPGTQKDGYILEHLLQELLQGIATAYAIFPQTKTIYLYLRKDYFDTYQNRIEQMVKEEFPDLPLTVFREPGGYLCGENTVLVNSIEGRRFEPRRKPPYISTVGLFGKPTIVNNLETFYRIGQIAHDCYHDTRFYSVTGDIPHPGVFDAPTVITIDMLLRQTDNIVPSDFFAQLGGGASGIYIAPGRFGETNANRGTGALIIYDPQKHPFETLLLEKLTFLIGENCGKCTPCREGIYRLTEMIKQHTFDADTFNDIAQAMAKTSFCGLGAGAGTSFVSLIKEKDALWHR